MGVEQKDRIIVALDTPDVDQAERWVAQLARYVRGFKVGLEYLVANGPQGVRALQDAGAERIFYDGKFCDIPNTVAGAITSVCEVGGWLANVHVTAGPEAMIAARKAAAAYMGGSGWRPNIVGVTVLTSLNWKALTQLRWLPYVKEIDGDDPEQKERQQAAVTGLVVHYAILAWASGLDGVVCSPLETEAVRKACGPNFLIVTPGIRPAGTDANDQARLATPGVAAKSGANYLVLGRAITGAQDPVAAAQAIVEEIALALS